MPHLTIREIVSDDGCIAYAVVNYGKTLATFDSPGEAEEFIAEFHQDWGDD